MLLALHVRDFRLLWGARLVSSLGSWLLVIAVPAHVLLLTGSVRATGLTLAAEYLPAVVAGPLAGLVADRWDRRRLMMATDLFRAVAVALLLLASSSVWVVYVALVAESAGTVLFNPAAQAHTPVVVGTGALLSGANAVNAVTDGTVRLIGGPVGGLLLAVVGFDGLVWVDVASYLVSAVAIRLTEPHPSLSVARPAAIAGFRALRGSPLVSALLPITAVYLLANACLSGVLVPFGLRELGGTRSLGFLLSGLGVGFLLGAPLARLLVDRVPVRYGLSAALVAVAGAYVVLFRSSSLVVALAAAVVVGTAGSVALIVPRTVVQRVLPNSVVGRVSAVFFAVEAVSTLVGALVGPVIAQASSFVVTGVLAGVVTFTAGLWCLRLPGGSRSPR